MMLKNMGELTNGFAGVRATGLVLVAGLTAAVNARYIGTTCPTSNFAAALADR